MFNNKDNANKRIKTLEEISEEYGNYSPSYIFMKHSTQNIDINDPEVINRGLEYFKKLVSSAKTKND